MLLQTPQGVLVLRSHTYHALRRFLILKDTVYIFVTCLPSKFFFSFFLRQFKLSCGFEKMVCRTNTCLQLEELATIDFGWLKNVYVAFSNFNWVIPFPFNKSDKFFVFR